MTAAICATIRVACLDRRASRRYRHRRSGSTVVLQGPELGVDVVAGKYVNGNTGTTICLGQLGGIVTGFFNAGGANSVLVEDSLSNVLVAGTMESDSTLISHVPNRTGTFSGTFHVTFVSPAVLALFGLGPGFSPNGSVALTTGGGNFDGTTFTREIGGGAVTIETTTAVPEPTGLGVLGMGLLTIAGGLRRWRARKTT